MIRISVILLLILSLSASAQDKKHEAKGPKFGTLILSLDSVSTKNLGTNIYTDSTKSFYMILKIGQDATLTTEGGARYARITEKELTPNQLQYIHAESEALAIDLFASKVKAKARQEIK